MKPTIARPATLRSAAAALPSRRPSAAVPVSAVTTAVSDVPAGGICCAGRLEPETREATKAANRRGSFTTYWQVVPGAHWASNEPFAVTVLVPPAGSVAVKVKVPRTEEDEELVITNWPDVELNICMLPPLV